MESAKIEEHNRIKMQLENVLTGTEYEEKTAKIINFIDAKRNQGKKALYTGALHEFGREDGRAIYQVLKKEVVDSKMANNS